MITGKHRKKHHLEDNNIIFRSSMVIYLAFIFFSTLSHLIGIYSKKKHFKYALDESSGNSHTGTILQVISSFSIIRNVQKILKTEGRNELHLECVSGLKFLCMGLIVPAHTLLFIISGPVVNTAFYEEVIESANLNETAFSSRKLIFTLCNSSH